MVETIKKWYQSTTLWSQIIAVLNSFLMMSVGLGWVPAKEGGIICGFVAAVASIFGINGRMKATTVIK